MRSRDKARILCRVFGHEWVWDVDKTIAPSLRFWSHTERCTKCGAVKSVTLRKGLIEEFICE